MVLHQIIGAASPVGEVKLSLLSVLVTGRRIGRFDSGIDCPFGDDSPPPSRVDLPLRCLSLHATLKEHQPRKVPRLFFRFSGSSFSPEEI